MVFLLWITVGITELMVFFYSAVNGTDLGTRSSSCSVSNGVEGQEPSRSCSPAPHHVVNSDAPPNSTPLHQPSDSDTESRTGEIRVHIYSRYSLCFAGFGQATFQFDLIVNLVNSTFLVIGWGLESVSRICQRLCSKIPWRDEQKKRKESRVPCSVETREGHK